MVPFSQLRDIERTHSTIWWLCAWCYETEFLANDCAYACVCIFHFVHTTTTTSSKSAFFFLWSVEEEKTKNFHATVDDEFTQTILWSVSLSFGQARFNHTKWIPFRQWTSTEIETKIALFFHFIFFLFCSLKVFWANRFYRFQNEIITLDLIKYKMQFSQQMTLCVNASKPIWSKDEKELV